jgi:hypothetical protein
MLERQSRFVIFELFLICLLLPSVYAAAATVTFSYVGTDSAGATVSGTFGYDTDAPDINGNTFSGTYLTGFLNGTIAGGAADGLSFDLNLSGAQTEGHLKILISANDFFSTLWITEIAEGGVGEWMRLELESTSAVFGDTSLPTELDIADWSRKNLDIRSLAPNANLFELTEINNIPAVTGQFGDVPPDYWAFSFIETFATNGITSGCGGGDYCPEDPVTRAQMAVFLERGMRGSGYKPPPATGNTFLDVGVNDFAAAWIEQFFLDGITGGCGGNNYCPNNPVTRAQMAVFLLRAKHGAGYSPPPAIGVFADAPLGSFAVAWIEQLAAEGITGGCGGGNYCPNDPVTRAQMAVFLVRTFDLE